MRWHCVGCGRELSPFDDPQGITANWLSIHDGHSGGWSISAALQRGRSNETDAPLRCSCGSQRVRQ